jgi:hypothetical protein
VVTDGQTDATIRPCLQARVAAFGSQDLGFRTSINGHWVSLSGPGFQDLESYPWVSLSVVSSGMNSSKTPRVIELVVKCSGERMKLLIMGSTGVEMVFKHY